MATEQPALGGSVPRISIAGAIALVAVPVLLSAIVYERLVGLWLWTDDFLWLGVAADLEFGEAVREAFAYPRGAGPYWRPFVDIYFFVTYRAFGLEGTPYHVLTLVFHIGAASLLGLLAFRLTRSEPLGALAAGLFAISPTYSAMVPWATGITAAMSGFFSVAMALCFLEYLRKGGYLWLALSGAALAAALLSKEDAAALPAVLVIMAVALRPPTSLRHLREVGLLVLPLIGLWLAYALPQFIAVIGTPEARQFEVGWHAAPRLGLALRWISLPWPLWYADWVEAGRWAGLGVFAFVALVAALRRAWLLPALYLATVALLLPSSFLDISFAPRWTYHASLSWAFFVAVLVVGGYERLARLHRPTALVIAGAVTFGLIAVLSARAIEAQNWVPRNSDEMRRIERALVMGCTGTSEGSNVYYFDLNAPPPRYALTGMLGLRRPGASLYAMQPENLLTVPLPQPGDCALALGWDGDYKVRTVDQGQGGFAFWIAPGAPDLLVGDTEVIPDRGTVEDTPEGLVVSSTSASYGVEFRETAPVQDLTYVASAMVRSGEGSGAMEVSISLTQDIPSVATVTLTEEWRRVAVYHRAEAGRPSPMSVEVTAHTDGERGTSFLVKDAEIRLLSIQSPLQ